MCNESGAHVIAFQSDTSSQFVSSIFKDPPNGAPTLFPSVKDIIYNRSRELTARSSKNAPKSSQQLARNLICSKRFARERHDVDLESRGDTEAFKRHVIEDVATAANIDAKHVKVTALHAGSVVVDILIAKEAGDVQKIVCEILERSSDFPTLP